MIDYKFKLVKDDTSAKIYLEGRDNYIAAIKLFKKEYYLYLYLPLVTSIDMENLFTDDLDEALNYGLEKAALLLSLKSGLLNNFIKFCNKERGGLK